MVSISPSGRRGAVHQCGCRRAMPSCSQLVCGLAAMCRPVAFTRGGGVGMLSGDASAAHAYAIARTACVHFIAPAHPHPPRWPPSAGRLGVGAGGDARGGELCAGADLPGAAELRRAAAQLHLLQRARGRGHAGDLQLGVLHQLQRRLGRHRLQQRGPHQLVHPHAVHRLLHRRPLRQQRRPRHRRGRHHRAAGLLGGRPAQPHPHAHHSHMRLAIYPHLVPASAYVHRE
mmetsp:Transcript_15647/g.39768  ORF Transcript_15647/g.39768 Transcript_15647/m.39768 type:complete len:230 (-) Transcript_15647:65-754(-)